MTDEPGRQDTPERLNGAQALIKSLELEGVE